MTEIKKIHWNGFLKHCIDQYPKEACGFLFSKMPFSLEEEWYVFSVENISKNPLEQWIPHKKGMGQVKNKAVKMGLVKIGNIHTHPYPEGEKITNDVIEDFLLPSPEDLRFARKHNDIVRGIIVCDKEHNYAILFHDKFGNNLKIIATGITYYTGIEPKELNEK